LIKASCIITINIFLQLLIYIVSHKIHSHVAATNFTTKTIFIFLKSETQCKIGCNSKLKNTPGPRKKKLQMLFLIILNNTVHETFVMQHHEETWQK